MVRLRLGVYLALLGATLGHAPASACSRTLLHYTKTQIAQMAARSFATATLVGDAEVISAMADPADLPEGALPIAYIKFSNIWKGQLPPENDNIAPVAYLSTCDNFFGAKGQKFRVLLVGNGIFTADQEINGWASVYEGDAYNQEIDRLVGRPRPSDFSLPGAPPPLKSE